MQRSATIIVAVSIFCCLALSLAGCHKSAAHGIAGEYLSTDRQGAHLLITSDTIQADVGQLFFNVRYKILSTDGDNMALEIDDGVTAKTQVALRQSGDSITFRNNYILNGTWKRK